MTTDRYVPIPRGVAVMEKEMPRVLRMLNLWARFESVIGITSPGVILSVVGADVEVDLFRILSFIINLRSTL